ncbi:DUF1194 domain-containing protein [Pseudorhodobacter sp.]|uniref:DUF1194 domain-containing protein n=1 Tax=Pseudorhodobacter sp. TaxID=1934400 RepID=UPI002649AC9D|nr:DUF1194 domain-containing protein [Pseudorhodobacter sp.]MDN5789108.1 DUF1194 domain-containing protein [Pseudorhodobacter sp.]
MKRKWLPALLLLGPTGPARACDTALLLAIDVSGSIDRGEYALQIQGLADALADAQVADALIEGENAIAVMQWSGRGDQAMVIPWQRITSTEILRGVEMQARTLPRAFLSSNTAVGEAISTAAAQFTATPDCKRHVIDISGDGPENAGSDLGRARSTAHAQGITINAIAIEDMGASAPTSQFYKNSVVTPKGFVLTARGLDDYARAIRAKLLRELIKPMG